MATIEKTYEEIQEEFETFLNVPNKPYDKDLDEKYWTEVERNGYTGERRFQTYYKGFIEGGMLCAKEIGEMYMEGDYVEVDYSVASTCFERAAVRGHVGSMSRFAMAIFLEEDEDFYEDAMKWISKAVILGSVEGMILLSIWSAKFQGLRAYCECCLQLHYDKVIKKTEHTKPENRFLGWCAWTGLCCNQNHDMAEVYWDKCGKNDIPCRLLRRNLGNSSSTEQNREVPVVEFRNPVGGKGTCEKEKSFKSEYSSDSGKHEYNTEKTESTIQKQTNDSTISREMPEDRIETQETLKNHSKIFSIVAIVLALFAVNPLMCIIAFCCALWAKKKQEKWAKAALIIAAIAFVLCLL